MADPKHIESRALYEDIANKTAIITRGARGQGASHARTLAGYGVKVVVADIRDELGAAWSTKCVCTDAEWDDVINTNLTGTFRGMRAVVPAMRRPGGGVIVNISSVFGIQGAGDMPDTSPASSGSPESRSRRR